MKTLTKLLALALALAGCGAEETDTGLSESPAFNPNAAVVRVRFEIAVQVPDDQRSHLQVVINGAPQEMVDIPVNPQPADDSEEGRQDPEAMAEAMRASTIRFARIEYATVVPWGQRDSRRLAGGIQVLDTVTGDVLAESSGYFGSLCSEEQPPPIEVYERATLAFRAEWAPQWSLHGTGYGCLYQDPERNQEGDA